MSDERPTPMTQCMNCENELAPDAVGPQCQECVGKPNPATAIIGNGWTCPCGEKIADVMASCPKCVKPIEKLRCPACSAANDPNATECSTCGAAATGPGEEKPTSTWRCPVCKDAIAREECCTRCGQCEPIEDIEKRHAANATDDREEPIEIQKCHRPLTEYEQQAVDASDNFVCAECGKTRINHEGGKSCAEARSQIVKCRGCGGALDDDKVCATPGCIYRATPQKCSGCHEPLATQRVCPVCTDNPVTRAFGQQSSDDMTGLDGGAILKLLHDKGVISGMAERVIIDIQVGEPIRVYVQQYASVSFLNIVMGAPVINAILKGDTLEIESGDAGSTAEEDDSAGGGYCP